MPVNPRPRRQLTKQLSPAVLRLTIKLYQDEYPLLLEDLLKARKGQRRTARLATLASIGLLAERNVLGMNATHVHLPAPSANPIAAEDARARGDGVEGGLSDEDLASVFGATTLYET